MRRWSPRLLVVLMLSAACGGAPAPLRASLNARQALTSAPGLLDVESVATRQELFKEIARQSDLEAGQAARTLVFFPVNQAGQLIAARGLEGRSDLFDAPDAGAALNLTFEGGAAEQWLEGRREGLQGLSERECAELVARTLLNHWGIRPEGSVLVDRAEGAPYAVAYVDGILRVNPSFLYLAAASGPSVAP